MIKAPFKLFLMAVLTACGSEDSPKGSRSSDSAPRGSDFVSSQVCSECHAEQFGRWKGSHHDLAMQHATEETVLGDFSDVVLEHDGRTTRFFRRDGSFWVNTEGPDGKPADYLISYTFGADPLQQYLIEFPGGRYQCLDVAWDVNLDRWFDVFPGDLVEPGDEYHWTGRFQTWNLQCADCHSTFFEKNYNQGTDSYTSTYQEINVGCESCHGAGAQHVELARQWDSGRPEGEPLGLLVDLDKSNAPEVLNACAACHSRRTAITDSHMPGARFEDDYRLAMLDIDLYHSDGQIREEVYVLGSYLQSKMHQAGVSCVDCHDPHGLGLWLPGDSTCTQCHSPEAPLDRFPTLKQKVYADPSHHFHPPESEGARCVNCHMPETTYMVIDPRRDHSLRVPRPDLTEALGTPNACNECHEDQSAEWASARIEEWYGQERPAHYGSALGSVLSGDPVGIRSLLALPFDEAQPVIVRASAVDRLPPGEQVTLQVAVGLLNQDELDSTLRASALASLLEAPVQLLVAIVPRFLRDPARIVRIEAANVLAGEAEAQLDDEQRKSFEAAFIEFEEAQLANSDSPFAHLNLGVVFERRGQVPRAIAAYRKALELDSGFLPAIFNLANLLNAAGRVDQAALLLRDAIERFPREGELQYSLGLLLAGAGQVAESVEALRMATLAMPDRARIHYNLGLAYSQSDQKIEAEGALMRALRLEPTEPDFMYALATFYLEIDELERALEHANQLAAAVPGAPGPEQLRAEIVKRLEEER